MGGLGYTMVALTFFFAIYYNVIIAYAVHYLFAGMTPKAQLPWAVGPRALGAGEDNPHPKWSSLGNSSVRATCCYEQVLTAFSQSGQSTVRDAYCNLYLIPLFNCFVRLDLFNFDLVN